MFCCAEMRCWRNDVCAMRKMMCRCAAMEGESSQGELFAKLQASSPSQSSRAARCQLSQRESPWHDGKLSGSNAKCAVSPRGCFRRKPARQFAAYRCGPSREKRHQKRPQAFLMPNNKNQIPLKMPKAKRRAFIIVLLPKKAAAQACAAAFHIILPVQPWIAPHRPRSCRSGSVPRHGRSRRRGAAGRGRAPWHRSPAGWAGG